MAKILLVEDDNNLREIYGERLMAEGYDIVSASDGEEALQTAVTEKPDLIISDVMMPKISGFDMLDILRQTPETKDVKIIMMTALSQAEDKSRADSLGANKYLVKSQVTLEDVARVVHDLLGDGEEEPVTDTVTEESVASGTITSDMPVTAPDPIVQPTPPSTPMPIAEPPTEAAGVTDTTTPTMQQQAPVAPVGSPQTPMPVAEPVAQPAQPTITEPTMQPTMAQPAPSVPINTTPTPAPINPTYATQPTPQPIVQPTPPSTPMPIAEPPTEAAGVTDTTTPTMQQQAPVAPVSSPQTPMPPAEPVQPIATAPINPISATSSVSLASPQTDNQAQAAQAEDTETELNEIAEQIQQFADAPAETPQNQHQEPVHEPTQQDIIHAQNAAEDPTIVTPEQNVVRPDPTVPPVVPINTSNPEPASARKKIIQPVNGSGISMPDIHALYEQELAKEAAESPVSNPASGQVIAAPAETTEQNPLQSNPISADPTVSTAPVAPPLETVDVSQISGLYESEEEAALAAAAEQTTQQPQTENTQQNTPTSQPVTPQPTVNPSVNPNDPNNIAL